MKRVFKFATGVIIAAITGMSSQVAKADYTLNILHINDFHSRFLPINKYDSTCSEKGIAENKCFGGIARIKTKLDQRRTAVERAGGNVITLSAGDMFQGSMFYTTYKGTATGNLMNDMGFDAMVVGNHEFDDGPKGLAEFIDLAMFPVISGNTDVRKEPLLKGKIPGFSLITKGGEKIAIIGLTTQDTGKISSPGPNVVFRSAEVYLKALIPKLESRGVNKFIVLTHLGFNEDRRLAKSVKGIDAIVGGHSNTLLAVNAPRAVGPYPAIVKGPDGSDVPIVSAYAYGKYVGELKLTFDDQGNVISSEGQAHELNAFVTEDIGFKARVAKLNAPLKAVRQKLIGSSKEAINGDRKICRVTECAMGNLVADAMLDRVKDQGILIAIQNGGGIRASIDAGPITMGEVLTVLPFQNTLSTFQIKGEHLVTAMENGFSQVENAKGRFPQISGMRIAWDNSADAGKERIKQVQVRQDNQWTDIDPAKTYGVVTNNFLRSGGDGYKSFSVNGENAYDYGPGLETVVADYLANRNDYQPYTDGRIIKGAVFKDSVEDAVNVAAEPSAAQKPLEEQAKLASGDNKQKTSGTAAVAMTATIGAPPKKNSSSEPVVMSATIGAKPSTEQPAETTQQEPVAQGEIVPKPTRNPVKDPIVATGETGATQTKNPAQETVALTATIGAKPEPSVDPVAATSTEPETNTTSETRDYTVKDGDTLWIIAKEQLGDATLWKKIEEANGVESVSNLKPGKILKLPK